MSEQRYQSAPNTRAERENGRRQDANIDRNESERPTETAVEGDAPSENNGTPDLNLKVTQQPVNSILSRRIISGDAPDCDHHQTGDRDVAEASLSDPSAIDVSEVTVEGGSGRLEPIEPDAVREASGSPMAMAQGVNNAPLGAKSREKTVTLGVAPIPPFQPNPLGVTVPSVDWRRRQRQQTAIQQHPLDTMTDHQEPPTEATLDVMEPTSGDTDDAPRTGGASDTGRLPDPLSYLLGLDGVHVPSHEPLLICVDNAVSSAYLGIVETLGKRLYRERVGGTPTALRISDLEELCDEDRWIEAEGAITTIALSERDWKRLETEAESSWHRIWDNRIQTQLFAQEFGVLILNRRIMSTPGDHFPNICPSTPPVLNPDEQSKLARIASGFREIAGPSARTESFETFTQRFNFWQERKQETAWHRIEADCGHLFWDATVADDASLLHRRLKTFALRAMAKAIDDWNATDSVTALQQVVQTEYTLSRGGKENAIRADVYSTALPDEGAVAVEAETLFGSDRQSGSPRDTLRRTISKYDGTSVDHLVVLVDPLTVLTQGQTLAGINRRLKTAQGGPVMTLGTVDFSTGQLRTVRSVLEAWSSVLQSDTTCKDSQTTWSSAADETPCIVRNP